MEYIPGNDKYYDPPDEPTHGECSRCGEICDYGDMTSFGDLEICDACYDDYVSENKEEE